MTDFLSTLLYITFFLELILAPLIEILTSFLNIDNKTDSDVPPIPNFDSTTSFSLYWDYNKTPTARPLHSPNKNSSAYKLPLLSPQPTAHRTASKQYAASTASATRNLLPPLPQRRSRRRPHRKYPVCSVEKYAFCDIFGCLVARKRTCWSRSSSSSSAAAACTDASILLCDSRRILNAVAWRSAEYARCGYCNEYQDEGGLGGD